MARLRIFSSNLLVNRADPDDLRRVIAEVEPDVIAVQELGPSLAEVIAESHPHGRLDPQRRFFGLGIATTNPTNVRPLELDTRSGWVGRLESEHWPGLQSPVEVIGIHLLNPISWPWPRTRRSRRSQIAGVADYVAGSNGSRVIVGDMNSTPIWPEYKLLERLGTDAAKVTGTGRPTWSQFTWGPRLLRIDHAFVNGVEPIATRTIKIKGTDHRALVVDVEA